MKNKKKTVIPSHLHKKIQNHLTLATFTWQMRQKNTKVKMKPPHTHNNKKKSSDTL